MRARQETMAQGSPPPRRRLGIHAMQEVERTRIIEKRKSPEEELFTSWIEWYQKLITSLEDENKILEDKLRILKRKERPDKLLSTRDGLISSALSHLDERTNWLKEIGARAVG